jgi:hypothetical protein
VLQYTVSVLYREPKLLKAATVHLAEKAKSFDREPKLLKVQCHRDGVSVLYREPKLLKAILSFSSPSK